MAYADRDKTGTQVTTGIIVGAVTIGFLFLLVAALNFKATKKLITHLTTEDVKEKKEEPKKVEPPKKLDIKLPPPIVIPQQIVRTPPPVNAPAPVFAQPPRQEPVVVAPPPPPKPKLASSAVLKGGEITDEDYPDAARRNNETGTSHASFVVGTDGRVQSCDAHGASSTLDAEACKLIMRRFRYKPAQDEAGNPISQSISRNIRWTIPAE